MTSTPPIPPVQPTAYQQQTIGDFQPGRQKSARLSKTAMNMGTIALLPGLSLLFAPLGVIFGIIALAKKRPKPGLAITGIVLSCLGIFVVTPLAASIILPAFMRARVQARQTISQKNLSSIGKAAAMYAAENNDQYPQQLSRLVSTGKITEKMLRYPSHSDTGVAYCYLAPAKGAPAKTIMACEKAGFNEKGRNVLFVGRYVRRMTNDEFAEALAKPHNAKFAKALKRAEGP
ncbi:MAG: DUF4190 domain-containing protein [Phycisphaerae bacterium]|nr:DUF4190 domain-containing protein [Phycisphaerae bacterium]